MRQLPTTVRYSRSTLIGIARSLVIFAATISCTEPIAPGVALPRPVPFPRRRPIPFKCNVYRLIAHIYQRNLAHQ